MMTMNAPVARIISFLLVIISTPAFALVTWPTGPVPCNNINSIGDCINGVAAGEVIEIEANAIPSQSGITVSPAKSFTLRPAAGFVPVFADFTSLFFQGSGADITVVVEGITIVRGGIRARQGGAGTFNVTLRNNVIMQAFNSAIEVSSSNSQPPYGPVVFLIEGNSVSIDNVSATGISVGGFQGDNNVGAILSNSLDMTETGQFSAIDVNGPTGFTMDVDVIGNEITGTNYNSGIALSGGGNSGLLTARAINNVVSGQFGNSGGPAAIALRNSAMNGQTDFTVINNTLAYNRTGILYSGRPDLGATSTALIFNNIVAFNSQNGMSLNEFDATTTNNFNLVFGNGNNFYTPGPDSVQAAPRFVTMSDFRLRLLSAAIGAGSNAVVPIDIVTDVAGGVRIIFDVDAGAYESLYAVSLFADGFE